MQTKGEADRGSFLAFEPGRVDSLDLFRGLTIVSMIWVNDLAHVGGISAALKHAPETADAMTFPDVVFPAFLFMVGMSIPLALGRRVGRGDRLASILLHVVGRTAGLLAIGVLMVNIHGINPQATGLSRAGWAVLVYLGVILAWNAYPRSAAKPDTAFGGSVPRPVPPLLFALLRLAGVALLIYLATIYRGSEGNRVTWLRTQWWGILGLIGWAYLVSAAGYLILRGHPAGITGLIAMGIALCIAEKNGALGAFRVARAVNEYVSLGGHIGGHAAIVLAGVLAMSLLRQAGTSPKAGVARLLFMAIVLFFAGLVLRHPYGISKVRVTPTWCLYCSALCCVTCAILYWLMDLRGYRRWTGPLRTVGTNALLAFILPGIVYGLLEIYQIDWLDRQFGTGGLGLVRSIVFTMLMVAVTAGLTRVHVRLRL